MGKLNLQVGKKYLRRDSTTVTIKKQMSHTIVPVFIDDWSNFYEADGAFVTDACDLRNIVMSDKDSPMAIIKELPEVPDHVDPTGGSKEERLRTIRFEGPSPDAEIQLEFSTDAGPYDRVFAPATGLNMPSPTAQELNSQLFLTIWEVIKRWDIGAPEYYGGYTGASGSHAVLISRAVTDLIDKKILK